MVIAMTRWEYKAVYWADGETKDDFECLGLDYHLDWLSKELSKYGMDGWELLNANDRMMTAADGFWLFRREIRGTDI